MQTTKQTLENIKANGYDIDFGTVFNSAFENYKKIALHVGLAIILLSIFGFIIVGIIAVGVIGIAFSTDSLSQLNVENMSPMWLVAYVFSMIMIAVIISPFNAGLIKMARLAYQGENFSVGTSLEYYKSSYFKEIVLATAIITFFVTVFSTVLQLAGFQWLGLVVNLLISILTFMTLPLIIFGNLKAMEAIEGSIIIVSKQFFILLGLLIVSGIFAVLGLFGFCIGIFFTMPFLYAMYYTIYREVIGDERSEMLSVTTPKE